MSGPRLVITLSEGTLDGLGRSLTRLGATWTRQPLLTFDEQSDREALASAIRDLHRFGAVAITSPRAAALYARAVAVMAITSPPVWTTGPGTARELRRLTAVHFVETPSPDGAAAELARMMLLHGVQGPVLFPCGERHHDELPVRLRDARLAVTELVCYRAIVAGDEAMRSAAASGEMLIVGSGRVAQALAAAVPAMNRPALIALGPVTARAARDAGWPPAAVADAPTIPSVLMTLHGVLNAFPGAVHR